MRNHFVHIKGWIVEEPRVAISDGEVCAVLAVRNSTEIKDAAGALQGRKAELTPVKVFGVNEAEYVLNRFRYGDFVSVKGRLDLANVDQSAVVADSIAKIPLARTSNLFGVTGQVGLDPQTGHDQHGKSKYHEIAVSTVAVLWDDPKGEQKGKWQSFTIPMSEQSREFISELKTGDTVKLEGQMRSFRGLDLDLGRVTITRNLQVDFFELIEKAKRIDDPVKLKLVEPEMKGNMPARQSNKPEYDMVPY